MYAVDADTGLPTDSGICTVPYQINIEETMNAENNMIDLTLEQIAAWTDGSAKGKDQSIASRG